MAYRHCELISDMRALVAADDTREPTGPHPRTRAECVHGPRPCPWVACRHNLLVDVSFAGSLYYSRAAYAYLHGDGLPPAQSCVLDVVDAHPEGVPLEMIGAVYGVTRQNADQYIESILPRLSRRADIGAVAAESGIGVRVRPPRSYIWTSGRAAAKRRIYNERKKKQRDGE